MREWISVKDQPIPTDGTGVLVTDGLSRTTALVSTDSWGQQHLVVYCYGVAMDAPKMTLEGVTHWMPLPDLPPVQSDEAATIPPKGYIAPTKPCPADNPGCAMGEYVEGPCSKCITEPQSDAANRPDPETAEVGPK